MSPICNIVKEEMGVSGKAIRDVVDRRIIDQGDERTPKPFKKVQSVNVAKKNPPIGGNVEEVAV